MNIYQRQTYILHLDILVLEIFHGDFNKLVKFLSFASFVTTFWIKWFMPLRYDDNSSVDVGLEAFSLSSSA